MDFTFDAELWEHDGDAAWHFLTLPFDVSDAIDAATEGMRRGFGSVRVDVRIGATAWSTSVFPDKGRESYVLPVKAEVRRREDLAAGSRPTVSLALADLP